ncbi:gephyrin-like molybdotransferase receptor GlpR [Gordonia shandongensis]|uniref:gephyrin-like molybdotransferase receptor GlpR n=1 Tax=Gordonia shandongensis TaxID=376351 RepID=UPI0004152469|nr:gephyrin-like molybdotransferase receptor GlpR [Gordonia shandongensis]
MLSSSVLWVALIAVWLFVLVPMVLRGRPQARRRTEAVTNTRLVHRGGSSRTATARTQTRTRAARRAAEKAGEQAQAAKRRAQAAVSLKERERESDRDADGVEDADGVNEWDDVLDGELLDGDLADGDLADGDLADGELADGELDMTDDEAVDDGSVEDDGGVEDEDGVEDDSIEAAGDDDAPTVRKAPYLESAVEVTDQLDVVPEHVVDLDEAQAAHAAEAPLADAVADDADFDAEYDEADGDLDEDADYEDAEYEDTEFDEDTGFDEVDEVESEPSFVPTPRERRGRGGYGPERGAEREQIRYRERRRVVAGFTIATLAAIVSAFFVQPWGIVAAVVMVAAFAAYLTFLRRTVREEQFRHAQRVARRRRQQEEDERLERRRAEQTYVDPPQRLRRPGGAVVLEIDDGDPAFDHLDTYDFAYYADRVDDGFDDEYRDYRRAAV